MAVKDFLCGNTIQVSWINSGVTPTDVYAACFTGSETVVDSATMVSSGNGFYYHLHTIPNTPGFYVIQTLATINSKPFKDRQIYQAVLQDVD
jgi:hypothetical protein